MWVCRYFIWFILYSVMGWIYESIFCTINERKWANRGFLFGPVCPIYGVGVVIMMAVWQMLQRQGVTVVPWQVFVLAAVGSAALEYVTSWVLEQLFHARWWDYTNMPLNINGRICLPASILFGLAGMLVSYVLYQPTMDLTAAVSPELIEVVALLLAILISIDATLTVSSLMRFVQAAESVSSAVNDYMDQLVSSAVERSSEAADTLALERDKVERRLRASRMGEMSAVVLSTVSRIRSIVPTSAETPAPIRQFERMWRDLRSK